MLGRVAPLQHTAKPEKAHEGLQARPPLCSGLLQIFGSSLDAEGFQCFHSFTRLGLVCNHAGGQASSNPLRSVRCLPVRPRFPCVFITEKDFI